MLDPHSSGTLAPPHNHHNHRDQVNPNFIGKVLMMPSKNCIPLQQNYSLSSFAFANAVHPSLRMENGAGSPAWESLSQTETDVDTDAFLAELAAQDAREQDLKALDVVISTASANQSSQSSVVPLEATREDVAQKDQADNEPSTISTQ
ncbi:hypothetical protein HDU76_005597 [Blyttiomyces sp. JEL0837]|nr:hypothetical protein HDU76_005597 [Blyttiomyces sp. JEL0837]